MSQEEAEHYVHILLDNLYDRSGFDEWWAGIDKTTKDEIRESLISDLLNNPL